MQWSELLSLIGSRSSARVCIDSRAVQAGDVFVAIKGSQSDGHAFIEQARAQGAGTIVCSDHAHAGPDTITVDNPARAAALLAQAAQGNPGAKLSNLAVTGTNGKTTVTYLVRSCMQAAGQSCGLIGTIGYHSGQHECAAPLTTPDCLTIAQQQAQMVQAGAQAMVIEASSHALVQERLAGIRFRAAAFTNLTGDHLDYHKTEQDYLAAKCLLFTGLDRDACAILNSDSPHAREIAGQTQASVLWYGVDSAADIEAHIESMDAQGTHFTLRYQGQSQAIRSPLLGRYNVSNQLAAAGLCLAAGLDLGTIAQGLVHQKTVPGRVERVDWPGDFTVLIDYAHTDDALKNVLSALKPLCHGRLMVVFGCGGDRDRSKRPRMARVAEDLADCQILTMDNPRTEDPERIMQDMVEGLHSPQADTVHIEADRAQAIGYALESACTGDVVLIAGKGHEDYQILGQERIHFSDREVALECLNRIMQL